MSDKLIKSLAKLKAKDVELDARGRLVIKNKDIAESLKNLTFANPDIGAAADNYGCCKNGVACDKASIAGLSIDEL